MQSCVVGRNAVGNHCAKLPQPHFRCRSRSVHSLPFFYGKLGRSPSPQVLIPRATGNNDNKEPENKEEERKFPFNIKLNKEYQILLNLLVAYPGVKGTIAVAAGYYLHINPLGTFNLDQRDAAIGFAFAIPIVLLDAIIIGGDWHPKRELRTIKLKVPRSIAEQSVKPTGDSSSSSTTSTTTATQTESSSSDSTTTAAPSAAATVTAATTTTSDEPDLIEVERQVPVRSTQDPFKEAMYRLQTEKVLGNPGRFLSTQSEVILTLAVHLAEEMLYRGVLLTAAAKWCTDFLYTTTFDDFFILPGGMELSIPQAGALIAASGMTASAMILAVQRELVSPQIQAMIMKVQAEREAAKQESRPVSSTTTKLEKMLNDAKLLMQQKQRWAAAFEASSEFLQWSTACTSFLITGNLIAPLAGAIGADLLYSVLQRNKLKELEDLQLKDAKTAMEQMKYIRDSVRATNELRKNRLQPPSSLNSNGAATDEQSNSSEADDDDDSKLDEQILIVDRFTPISSSDTKKEEEDSTSPPGDDTHES